MIETARLILRPAVVDDLGFTLDHINTAAVMRHLGGVRDRAKVAAGFSDGLEAFARDGFGYFTILLRESGVRVGKCGLSGMSADPAPAALDGQIEIGWSLAEPYWGKGYASEAARAVIDFFFTKGAAPVLYSQTSETNRASTRMMARLGFARCAELDYVDPGYPALDNPTTVYRLDRESWEVRG